MELPKLKPHKEVFKHLSKWDVISRLLDWGFVWVFGVLFAIGVHDSNYFIMTLTSVVPLLVNMLNTRTLEIMMDTTHMRGEIKGMEDMNKFWQELRGEVNEVK